MLTLGILDSVSIGGAPPPPVVTGEILSWFGAYRTDADAFNSLAVPVEFASEAHDPDDWFATPNASPPVAGYARFGAYIQGDNGLSWGGAKISKAGANFVGMGRATAYTGLRFNMQTAIIPVLDTDSFRVNTSAGARGGVTLEANPFFYGELIPEANLACLVHLSTDGPAATGTIAVPWETEAYDIDGYWSAGDPTKIIIPVGHAGRFRLTACIDRPDAVDAANVYHLFASLNGTKISRAHSDESTYGCAISLSTDIMDLNEGDELIVSYYGNGAWDLTSSDNLQGCWACLEKIPPERDVCVVSWYGTPTTSVDLAMPWITEHIDDNSMVSTGVNAITIPAGAVKARISMGCRDSHNGSNSVKLYSTIDGIGEGAFGNITDYSLTTSASGEACNAMGPWFPVTGGEVINGYILITSARTFTAAQAIWMCVEVEYE